MSETKPTTVIDLLSAVLAETCSATTDDDPVEYFAFRGALLDLSKSYVLAHLAVKEGRNSGNHHIAMELRDRLCVLMETYTNEKKPAASVKVETETAAHVYY